jgi:hypothetical protein
VTSATGIITSVIDETTIAVPTTTFATVTTTAPPSTLFTCPGITSPQCCQLAVGTLLGLTCNLGM